MWGRRDFAYTVAMGQLRTENQNTVLGSVWHLLNPIMLAGVYYLVFGVVLGARGAVHDNYVAFLVTGLFTFFFSQKVIMGGTRVITTNLNLITNIRFPRALLPVSSTIQETYAQIPAVLTMFVIVLLTGDDLSRLFGEVPAEDARLYLSWTWIFAVPIVLMQSVFNLGASFIVARLTFHFRDMQFIVTYLMRIMFYSSGVFFGVEQVSDMVDSDLAPRIFAWNPFYVFIHLMRHAIMEQSTEPAYWGRAAVWAFGTLVVGFVFFRRRELEYSRG